MNPTEAEKSWSWEYKLLNKVSKQHINSSLFISNETFFNVADVHEFKEVEDHWILKFSCRISNGVSPMLIPRITQSLSCYQLRHPLLMTTQLTLLSLSSQLFCLWNALHGLGRRNWFISSWGQGKGCRVKSHPSMPPKWDFKATWNTKRLLSRGAQPVGMVWGPPVGQIGPHVLGSDPALPSLTPPAGWGPPILPWSLATGSVPVSPYWGPELPPLGMCHWVWALHCLPWLCATSTASFSSVPSPLALCCPRCFPGSLHHPYHFPGVPHCQIWALHCFCASLCCRIGPCTASNRALCPDWALGHICTLI